MNLVSNSAKKILFFIYLTLIITIIWNSLLYFYNLKESIYNILFNIPIAFLHLIGAMYGLSIGFANSWQRPTGRTIILLSLGIISNALGFLSWTYFSLSNIESIPYPSFADLFFVIGMILFILGINSMIRIFSPDMKRQTLNVSILTTAVILIIVSLILYQYNALSFRDESILGSIFNIYYIFSDIILLSLSYVVWQLRSFTVFKGMRIFALGFLITGCADLIFGINEANSTYWNGSISDSLFALAGFCFSFGIILAADYFKNDIRKVQDLNIQKV